MAEINLRAYIKNIDELVEQTKLDEAIAHCRHILEIYPKHLATYRLLGKAYLEAKRYGDAADIFQRVLSAIPDDFVAHIGMAIVREDEGNLDAAIWHMERAFETNPANPAIQQELRRLIGSRDGLEPHKVRLTRGALARMYAHGELYPQAIAELLAALHEDAGRPDLQALLATMYWRAGQHAEAGEVCNQLIEKLPYCRDANQIMGAILQASGRTDEAAVYHKRLAALDPYAAFIETASVDPQTVDANSVRIEKLEWRPSMPAPMPTPTPTPEVREPDWATSFGMEADEDKLEEPVEAAEPIWLRDLDAPEEEEAPEAVEATPFEPSVDTPVPEATSEDQIPDWMKDAGWRESSSDIPEPRVSFSDEELAELEKGITPVAEEATPPEDEEGPSDELAPAEIPDWIQEIAPQTDQEPPPEPTPEPTSAEAEIEPLPDWLGELAEDAAVVQPEPDLAIREEPEPPEEELEPIVEEEVEGDVSELPAWLDQESPGATSTIVSWLGERKVEGEEVSPAPSDLEEAAKPTPEGEIEPTAAEVLPDWLRQLESSEPELEPETPPASEEAAPSWLAGVAEVAAQQDLSATEAEPLPEEPTPEPEAERPEWLDETPEAEPEQPAEEAKPEPEAPDWLKSIAEPVSELPTEGEPTVEAAPDWLASGGEEEDQIPSLERPESVEGPDWLQGIGEPEVALPPETGEGMADAPDWLRGIEEEPSELEPVPEPQASLDWLRELQGDEVAEPLDAGEEAEVPAPSLEDETFEPEPAAEAAPGESMDDDEIFEWLEGLAARQGAAEEELITTPDKRTTEPPASIEALMETPGVTEEPIPAEPEEGLEWLERLASERGIDADISLPETEEPPPEAEETLEAPAWLGSMATEPTSIPPGEAEETIPDWLDRGEPEAAQPAEELPPELPPEEPEIVAEEFEIQEIEPQLDTELPREETPPIEPAPPEEPLEWLPAEETLPTAEEPTEQEPPAVVWERPAVEEPQPPIVEPTLEERVEEVPLEIPAETLDVETVPSGVARIKAPEEFEPAAPASTEPPEPPATPPEPVPAPVEAAPEVPATPPETVADISEPEEVIPAEEIPKPPPPPPSKPKAKPSASELLDRARQSLAQGDMQEAVKNYVQLTKQKASLDTVIDDLRIAIERNPNQPTLWQALGDAYMKADRLGEAIEAYRKGTEATT